MTQFVCSEEALHFLEALEDCCEKMHAPSLKDLPEIGSRLLYSLEKDGLIRWDRVSHLHPGFHDALYITYLGRELIDSVKLKTDVDLSLDLLDENNHPRVDPDEGTKE